MGNICRRAYDVTIPWNQTVVKLPEKSFSTFPKFDNLSADFACKNIKVTIENEAGTFTGSVDTKTNLPSGYGVFETSEWIHCGKF